MVTIDVIYSYLCSRQNINKPHYKNNDEIAVYAKKKTNKMVFNIVAVFSFILIFISSAIAINNYSLSQLSEKIKQEKEHFNASYNERFYAIQDKIDNIDTFSLFIEDSLNRQAQAKLLPTDLFVELSHILDHNRFNQVAIDQIKWKRYIGVEYDGVNALFPQEEMQQEYTDDLGLDVVPEEEKSGVYAHISGTFDHQYLDYAGAVDTMVFFNNSLKTISYVDDVYMISAPIDARSHAQFIDFSGSLLSLNVSQNNSFEFVLSIKDGARKVVYE